MTAIMILRLVFLGITLGFLVAGGILMKNDAVYVICKFGVAFGFLADAIAYTADWIMRISGK